MSNNCLLIFIFSYLLDFLLFVTEIRCDMNRRMDSAHLWMNAEEETPMSDVRDKNITINALPPMVKDGKSKRPRPNIDIILSLKDPVYSSIMMGYFQLMGEKTAVNTTTTPEIESVESVIAKKALLHFKRTSTTTTVRFFKLLSRNIIDGVFEEVDEKATLQSESALYISKCLSNTDLHGSYVFIWISLLNFLYHFSSCQKFVVT